MKTKFGIVGCGFLGNIVADAWKKGLLEDYELVGVTSRTFASAEKTAASVGCAACADVDALLALEPEYIVEAASVEAVRAMAVPVLRRGVNLVVLSIGCLLYTSLRRYIICFPRFLRPRPSAAVTRAHSPGSVSYTHLSAVSATIMV